KKWSWLRIFQLLLGLVFLFSSIYESHWVGYVVGGFLLFEAIKGLSSGETPMKQPKYKEEDEEIQASSSLLNIQTFSKDSGIKHGLTNKNDS
ncbi:hypothetical protein, partial [Xanthovirga aplysinae]|uniref:hypothetical protein n=1 Tax=Xanthovirga aplysinae TaxID=2529853 RepID=UPI001656F207